MYTPPLTYIFLSFTSFSHSHTTHLFTPGTCHSPLSLSHSSLSLSLIHLSHTYTPLTSSHTHTHTHTRLTSSLLTLVIHLSLSLIHLSHIHTTHTPLPSSHHIHTTHLFHSSHTHTHTHHSLTCDAAGLGSPGRGRSRGRTGQQWGTNRQWHSLSTPQPPPGSWHTTRTQTAHLEEVRKILNFSNHHQLSSPVTAHPMLDCILYSAYNYLEGLKINFKALIFNKL